MKLKTRVFLLGRSSVAKNFARDLFFESNEVDSFVFKNTDGVVLKNVEPLSWHLLFQKEKYVNIFPFFSPLDLLVIFFLKLKRQRVTYCFHDFYLHKGERNVLIQLILFFNYIFSCKIVVFNKNVQDDVKGSYLYKWFKKPVYLLAHGIRQSNKPVLSLPTDSSLNLLFFGRVVKYKGLHILIQALKNIELDENKLRVIVCGNGKIEEELLNEMYVDNRVEIINSWVSEEFVMDLFAKTHLMVMPYVGATQSGVMAKAFEYNIPCLITPDPGLVHQGGYGSFISHSFKPEDFSNLIKEIIDNPEEVRKKSIEINKRKGEFTYSRIGKNLIDISWY